MSSPSRFDLSRRDFLAFAIHSTTLILASSCASQFATGRSNPNQRRSPLIGYTEYRTNLPTRHANQVTSRACAVRADGTGRRMLAEVLVNEPNAWTQFAGFSPDGRSAIIGRGWESAENAAWEEEHKTFRMTEGWLYDVYLLDLESGDLTNLTSVERVSLYNSGVVYLPNSDKLGFTALIDGVSHPFVMDRDGRNKRDISEGAEGFIYGFSASPDGKLVAYHKDYQIYVANADGSHARQIETGNPFNFVPQWSPDGQRLMFVSGEHYNCHPYIVHPDGRGLRKIADRGGHKGFVTVYDVYDFHNGSSDVPVWSTNGGHVIYTALVDGAVELMRVSLDGTIEQLTSSPEGAFNYHPKPSADGRALVFGSTRSGTRQLYVIPNDGGEPAAITQVHEGHGAMWAHWQP